MVFDDGLNFGAHLFFDKSWMCNSEAHWHNLNSDDPNLIVNSPILDTIVRIQLLKEVNIRVQANAYAVDEDDGQFGFGSMWTMPISEMFGWRLILAKKANWSQWEQREEL